MYVSKVITESGFHVKLACVNNTKRYYGFFKDKLKFSKGMEGKQNRESALSSAQDWNYYSNAV